MCDNFSNAQSKFRLARCGHGKYHLTFRGATFHLSPSEMKNLISLMINVIQHNSEEIDADIEQEESDRRLQDRFMDNWKNLN